MIPFSHLNIFYTCLNCLAITVVLLLTVSALRGTWVYSSSHFPVRFSYLPCLGAVFSTICDSFFLSFLTKLSVTGFSSRVDLTLSLGTCSTYCQAPTHALGLTGFEVQQPHAPAPGPFSSAPPFLVWLIAWKSFLRKSPDYI